MGTDELIEQTERAQAEVHRWSRIEVVLFACTAAIIVVVMVAAAFVVPIRQAVSENRCIVKAQANAEARYQSIVATFQNTPPGSPEREVGNKAITANVRALRHSLDGCS